MSTRKQKKNIRPKVTSAGRSSLRTPASNSLLRLPIGANWFYAPDVEEVWVRDGNQYMCVCGATLEALWVILFGETEVISMHGSKTEKKNTRSKSKKQKR